MDDWGVDVAVTGSQKAMSIPTGLAYVAASKKVRVHCCSVTADQQSCKCLSSEHVASSWDVFHGARGRK